MLSDSRILKHESNFAGGMRVSDLHEAVELDLPEGSGLLWLVDAFLTIAWWKSWAIGRQSWVFWFLIHLPDFWLLFHPTDFRWLEWWGFGEIVQSHGGVGGPGVPLSTRCQEVKISWVENRWSHWSGSHEAFWSASEATNERLSEQTAKRWSGSHEFTWEHVQKVETHMVKLT